MSSILFKQNEAIPQSDVYEAISEFCKEHGAAKGAAILMRYISGILASHGSPLVQVDSVLPPETAKTFLEAAPLPGSVGYTKERGMLMNKVVELLKEHGEGGLQKMQFGAFGGREYMDTPVGRGVLWEVWLRYGPTPTIEIHPDTGVSKSVEANALDILQLRRLVHVMCQWAEMKKDREQNMDIIGNAEN